MRAISKYMRRCLTLCCVLGILLSMAVLPAGATDQGDKTAVLRDVSILFVGDSYLAGYGLPDIADSWCERLGRDYGMKCTNIAISGSTLVSTPNKQYVAYGGCSEPICERELPEGTFDIVFLDGGSNDWACGAPLGAPDSRDVITFRGAMNVTIDRIREKYPDALLVYMTPWNSAGFVNSLGLTTDHYVTAGISVCENRGVTVFYACDPAVSGIDASSLESRDGTFLIKYDIWHLNIEGHSKLLPVMAQWLTDVVNEELGEKRGPMEFSVEGFLTWAKNHLRFPDSTSK